MTKHCGAKTKGKGTPCKRPAGWGTDHVGKGRCKLHGGNAGRPIVHGRYSVKHRESLQAKIEEYLSDPQPGNLLHELALQRALLQDFLDRLGDPLLISVDLRKHAFDMIESISKVVERISRILNQTALTQAELQFLQASLTNLIVKYIDDPEKRYEFVVELRSLIKGDSDTTRGPTLPAPTE